MTNKHQYSNPNIAIDALNQLEKMHIYEFELMDIYFMRGSIFYDNKNYHEAMIAFKELLKLQININPGEQVINKLITQARAKIGMMYMDGQGTEINLVEAANYLTLAFRNHYIEEGLKRVLSKRLATIKTELQKVLTNLEII